MERLYMVVKLSNEPESEEEEQKCEERPAEYMSAKRTSTPEMLAKVIVFDAAHRSKSGALGGFEMSSAGGCGGIAEEDEDKNSDKDEENEGDQQQIHEEYRD